jgi:hypothetical protein
MLPFLTTISGTLHLLPIAITPHPFFFFGRVFLLFALGCDFRSCRRLHFSCSCCDRPTVGCLADGPLCLRAIDYLACLSSPSIVTPLRVTLGREIIHCQRNRSISPLSLLFRSSETLDETARLQSRRSASHFPAHPPAQLQLIASLGTSLGAPASPCSSCSPNEPAPCCVLLGHNHVLVTA